MSTATPPPASGARRRRRRPVPERTYQRPRASLLYVAGRTWHRLLEIQVWDVAAAMTFFAVLALLPASVALVALVSVLDLREESAAAAASLVAQLWPALPADEVEAWMLTLGAQESGGVAVAFGVLGAVFSASGVVAAFHRAMHRIHDTREGRPLPLFRLVVFLETLGLLLCAVVILVLVVVGGDLAHRVGALLRLDAAAVHAWELGKWPFILLLISLLVSLAYTLGPNVRPPRWRPLSTGAVAVVAVLFGSTAVLGWITDRFGDWALVGRINSALGVLSLAWLAGVVVVAGAAWDAEVLRARQLAAGLPAEAEIQLATRHCAVLEAVEREERRDREVGELVRTAAADGAAVTVPRTPLLAEAGSVLAVGTAGRDAHELSSGRPFHAAQD